MATTDEEDNSGKTHPLSNLNIPWEIVADFRRTDERNRLATDMRATGMYLNKPGNVGVDREEANLLRAINDCFSQQHQSPFQQGDIIRACHEVRHYLTALNKSSLPYQIYNLLILHTMFRFFAVGAPFFSGDSDDQRTKLFEELKKTLSLIKPKPLEMVAEEDSSLTIIDSQAGAIDYLGTWTHIYHGDCASGSLQTPFVEAFIGYLSSDK